MDQVQRDIPMARNGHKNLINSTLVLSQDGDFKRYSNHKNELIWKPKKLGPLLTTEAS